MLLSNQTARQISRFREKYIYFPDLANIDRLAITKAEVIALHGDSDRLKVEICMFNVAVLTVKGLNIRHSR